MTQTPFDSEQDVNLGRMLREQLTGPEPEAFLLRLRRSVEDAVRDDEWDILERWARPRVLAAAIAAGFLLWFGAWRLATRAPAEDAGSLIASLPAHTMVMPQTTAMDEILTAIMEGK